MADLYEERDRGHRAQQIIDNPLWAETQEKIRNELTTAWRESAPTQGEDRETMYFMLIAAEQVFAEIESVLMTGKMAAKQIEEIENG